jgi:Amt family ammonium transporter
VDSGQGCADPVVWSGVVSFIAYKVVDLTIGLQVDRKKAEREGF